ncbi:CTB family bacteriocin [Kovacikia minuta CCNUW1]|uniref:CTB family bacteriocin n=1 Tax=Kovacikia minuta TaxID=2931930 RepID=UPI001CCF6DE9|nr:CTB family bacteriocin [Kovacikia minuta]UBF27135.1 CTB family bacteriocin [Kovacikia minuta CCNUW1]
MSEQIKIVELSADELDTVAGGVSELHIDSDFSKQTEATAQVFANGEKGSFFASETFNESIDSETSIHQFVDAGKSTL